MTVGKNIAVLRKEKGWTQAQLGERLGVSNQAISKWEQEMNLPDVMLLPTIAKVFGVTIDRLFEEIEAEEEVEISNKLIWVLKEEHDGGTLTIRYPVAAMKLMIEAQMEAAGMPMSEKIDQGLKEFYKMYEQPGVIMEQKTQWGKMKMEVVAYENQG